MQTLQCKQKQEYFVLWLKKMQIRPYLHNFVLNKLAYFKMLSLSQWLVIVRAIYEKVI